MYFLKIVNFSEDPVKEEPATAAPPLHAKTILRLKQIGALAKLQCLPSRIWVPYVLLWLPQE